MADCEKLRKYYQALRSRRRTVEQVWDLIERFIVPWRGKMFQEQTSEHEVNWRRGREIYDSTGIFAHDTLSASLHGSLTSWATRWFGFMYRNRELRNVKEAKVWLKECADTSFEALRESNFSLEAAETYLDITSFGSALVMEEEENPESNSWEGLDFQAVEIRSAFPDVDHKGRIRRLFIRYQWTALEARSKFEDNTPQDVVEKDESGQDVEQRDDYIFAVWVREGVIAQPGALLEPTKRPVGWCWFRDKDALQIGDEGGYYEMPAFMPRWRKVSGSQWGYSPATIALSDVLTLQELVQLILTAAAKAVDPPSLATEKGLLSDLDLEPGGLTIVRDLQRSVMPYDSKARFDVSALTKADLQASINRAFFVDQLELKESPAMTATEVQVRYELMQRLLGPTLGRLINDFLDPLVVRTFNILGRRGQLPDPPGVVQDAQAEYDIVYTGPLSRAQNLDEVAAVERWVMMLGNVAEVYPEVLDIPDVDEFGRGMGELLRVDPKMMRSKEEVDERRQKRQQDMERMKKLEMMAGAGQAAQAVGDGVAALQGADNGGARPS